MLQLQGYTVTVVVHGPQDTASAPLPNLSGSGYLKVSESMTVKLIEPDNPDEFTIDPGQSEAPQYVPANAMTTWMWKVTPKQPGKNQRLQIDASVIYPKGNVQMAEQLPSYMATVNVDVPPLAGTIERSLLTQFIENPVGALKYILPGGAGFAFLAGIFVWMKKRMSK